MNNVGKSFLTGFLESSSKELKVAEEREYEQLSAARTRREAAHAATYKMNKANAARQAEFFAYAKEGGVVNQRKLASALMPKDMPKDQQEAFMQDQYEKWESDPQALIRSVRSKYPIDPTADDYDSSQSVDSDHFEAKRKAFDGWGLANVLGLKPSTSRLSQAVKTAKQADKEAPEMPVGVFGKIPLTDRGKINNITNKSDHYIMTEGPLKDQRIEIGSIGKTNYARVGGSWVDVDKMGYTYRAATKEELEAGRAGAGGVIPGASKRQEELVLSKIKEDDEYSQSDFESGHLEQFTYSVGSIANKLQKQDKSLDDATAMERAYQMAKPALKDTSWRIPLIGWSINDRVAFTEADVAVSSGAGGPAIGTQKGGYEFTGGDPYDENNWKKL